MLPLHAQDRGPVHHTELAVPTLHRLALGAELKVCQFEPPHTPFIGVDEAVLGAEQ